MRQMLFVVFAFWYCALWTIGAGCQDTLWFQTSISNVSTLLRAKHSNKSRSLIAHQRVRDANECALVCFSNPVCLSAVFTPNNFQSQLERKRRDANLENDFYFDIGNWNRQKSGKCTLLPLAADCEPDIGLISKIDTQTDAPVLIYCLSCPDARKGPTSLEIENKHQFENQTDGVIERKTEEKTSSRRRKRARRFSLRVMTFNTWLSGYMVDKGLEKLAKHIQMHEPDIALLQEMSDNYINGLLNILGSKKWRVCSRNNGQFNHILTRHKISTEYEASSTFWNNGCQIQLYPPNEDFILNVWNVHLYQHNYGPYKACFKSAGMKSADELHQGEYSPRDNERSRLKDMLTLAKHQPFMEVLRQATTGQTPLIVGGDFNSPSHTDWIDASKYLHCQYAFDWPVSKFMHKMGFLDSYRQAQTDPVGYMGTTWSTIYKDSTTEFLQDGKPDQEPQDRIDYIYYMGNKLQVLDSFVYQGSETINQYPNYRYNDWPSDHAAVITTFAWG